MSHQGIKVLLLSVCVSYNIPEMEGGAAPKCDDDNPTVTIVHKYVAYQNYHRRNRQQSRASN